MIKYKTKMLPCHIDANADPAIWQDVLREGARLLQTGELVAFPTETVYGLGANVWDAEACARIFSVKGRPEDNPLIVHVASIEQARDVVASWPESAQLCAERFWPGPLTLVLPKKPAIPNVVTGGGDTVAVRVPGHPVARTLIAWAACPVAAPSANISGRPSPTRASHVWEDLRGRIPLIIDGGPCDVGLESTVLDLSGGRPVLLRPGGVPWEDLKDVLLGPGIGDSKVKDRDVGLENWDPIRHPTNNEHLARKSESLESPIVSKSPGMKYRHYAPRAPIDILSGSAEECVQKIMAAVQTNEVSLGLLCFAKTAALLEPWIIEAIDVLKIFADDDGVREGAAELFAALRACDEGNVTLILAEASEREQLGLAYMNRLEKAAGILNI